MDVHKRYTLARAEDGKGQLLCEKRIEHVPGAFSWFLRDREAGSPVAVETVGNWYWVVDEIEAAGFEPRLVNARLAKVMMGQVHKSDRLDCRGLNRLQRTGTLPAVWIAPAAVRDVRELPRTRMVLVRERTALKNRVHASLAKYGIRIESVSDIFGKRGRVLLGKALEELPPHTAHAVGCVLGQLDSLERQLKGLDAHIDETFGRSEQNTLLRTLPGVGRILSVVIESEIGDLSRFSRAQALCSYAGLVPRANASGGKSRPGPMVRQANQYLKWAFVEAANAAVLTGRQRNAERHVVALYQRIREKRGHGKAIGAVARHLCEAAYWVIKKHESYREPKRSTRG